MVKCLFAVSIITLLWILYSYTQVLPPTQYKLYQNAPDPFDTTGTYFRFDIPKDSASVYIIISDMHWSMIASLINYRLQAGEYQVYWNAKGMDSLYIVPGTYTCKISVVYQNQLMVAFRDSIHIHFEMNVGVQENTSNDIPLRFKLNQNYPNPFNPSTNISFSLPIKSFISLKVFDVIGREVATIVSTEMSAGKYTRQWNAADLPSGIFFCRLQAGLYTETNKLVLLR